MLVSMVKFGLAGTLLFGTGLIQPNQNFLDLQIVTEIQQLIDEADLDAKVADDLKERAKKAHSQEDLDQLKQDIQQAVDDKEEEVDESLLVFLDDEGEESSPSDDKKDEALDEEKETEDSSPDESNSDLLVFLEDDPSEDKKDEKEEEEDDKKESHATLKELKEAKFTYLFTDDLSIQTLEYQGVPEIKDVVDFFGDWPKDYEKESVAVVLFHESFDMIEVIQKMKSLLESFEMVYLSTDQENLKERLQLLQNYDANLQLVPFEELTR